MSCSAAERGTLHQDAPGRDAAQRQSTQGAKELTAQPLRPPADRRAEAPLPAVPSSPARCSGGGDRGGYRRNSRRDRVSADRGPRGLSDTTVASLRLHGRLYWLEDDTRTHLSSPTARYGRARDLWESVNILKRNAACAISEASPMWYLDFEGNWHAHPEIMRTVEQVRRIADQALARDRRRGGSAHLRRRRGLRLCQQRDGGRAHALRRREDHPPAAPAGSWMPSAARRWGRTSPASAWICAPTRRGCGGWSSAARSQPTLIADLKASLTCAPAGPR